MHEIREYDGPGGGSIAARWRRGRRWLSAGLLALCMAGPAGGREVHLRLERDRVWLTADGAPLQTVLRAFARLGVWVEVDPELRQWVTLEAEGRPLEDVLQDMLEESNYVLFWKELPSPQGPWTALSRMHVFRPGRKEAARPLAGGRAWMEVTPDRPGSPAHVRDEILLALGPGATREDFEALLARLGGTVIDTLAVPGVYRVRLPAGTDVPDLARQLSGQGLVAHAEPNYIYRLPGGGRAAAGDPRTTASARGDSGGDASAPAVAVLDSGLAPVEGMALRGAFDALDPRRPMGDPAGHGTQMALIASGRVDPGWGGGADASVPILAVRTFDEDGRSSGFDLMRAVNYAVDEEARLINMSWGSAAESPLLLGLLEHAGRQGVMLVAAAGNEPTGDRVYPAAYPGVLGVAAATEEGAIWERSNHGEFVDLAAPGKATLPVGYGGDPGTYAGTSIASAYVSHILARYFALHPGAEPAEAWAALAASLTDRGAWGRDPVYGEGLLDEAAVARFLE